MRLVIGLGNPGEKYKNTRHNTGWLVLDQLVKQTQNSKLKTPARLATRSVAGRQNHNSKLKANRKLRAKILKIVVGNKKIILAKPLTFMNKSGEAVSLLAASYKLQAASLIVVHDDLDISLGKYKIQFGKGPREHGGVESVERALGRKDFWRVRVGIENRNTRTREHENTRTKRISGERYVLQEFSKDEKKIIDKVTLEVIEEIKKKIRLS